MSLFFSIAGVTNPIKPVGQIPYDPVAQLSIATSQFASNTMSGTTGYGETAMIVLDDVMFGSGGWACSGRVVFGEHQGKDHSGENHQSDSYGWNV